MRKASLSLSINAIVSLIIAVVVLVLVLTFITSSWSSAKTPFERAMADIAQDRIDTTINDCDEFACLEFSTMNVRRTKTDKQLIVLNNYLDCDMDPGVKIEIDPNCQVLNEDDYTGLCDDISLSTFSPQVVSKNSKVAVPLEVKVKNEAKISTYRYKITAKGECNADVLEKLMFVDITVER